MRERGESGLQEPSKAEAIAKGKCPSHSRAAERRNLDEGVARAIGKSGMEQVLDKVQKSIHSTGMSSPVEVLRKHGIPVTAQRLAVLRAVSGHPHGTAEELAEIVRGEIGVISRQAVYDALGMLTDRGIIRRIQPAGSPARYEDRVGDNHHHLICRSCGATVDVDCIVGQKPCLEVAEDSGFHIDEAEVIFWGVCPTCQGESPGQSN